MVHSKIGFSASEQQLTKTSGPGAYSSNTIQYIEAHFDLDESWTGLDSVRAMWHTDFSCIATVLDSSGSCKVPREVLNRRGEVKVNLCGGIVEDDQFKERLTTYPIVALVVDADSRVCGSETVPITPSQFDQFAAAVKSDADRAEAGASAAEGSARLASDAANASERFSALSREYAESAEASASNAAQSAENASQSADDASASAASAATDADRAEQAAADGGFMFFHIDDAGHLIMEHTENVDDIDFSLVDGHLILEVA